MSQFESDHNLGEPTRPDIQKKSSFKTFATYFILFIVASSMVRFVMSENAAKKRRRMQNQVHVGSTNMILSPEQKQLKLLEKGRPLPYLKLSNVATTGIDGTDSITVECDVESRAYYATFDSLHLEVVRISDDKSDTADFWIDTELGPRSTSHVVGRTILKGAEENVDGESDTDSVEVRVVEAKSS